jgi:hypothetical protein
MLMGSWPGRGSGAVRWPRLMGVWNCRARRAGGAGRMRSEASGQPSGQPTRTDLQALTGTPVHYKPRSELSRPRSERCSCCMACKRPGVRIPLAPRFPRSSACCDLRKLLLSACNLASRPFPMIFPRLKPMQVRAMLYCGDTAVALPSVSDSQTDSQSAIRPTTSTRAAISSAPRCSATFGQPGRSPESAGGETADYALALVVSSLCLAERRVTIYGPWVRLL